LDEIIEGIRSNWNNPGLLEKILIDLIVEYREQAGRYANAVLAEASSFNTEMEETFKPSVTKAEYRAKELTGGTKIMADREMRAIELLSEAIKMRITTLNKIEGP
jgi:hypothetical protein